MQNPTAKHSIAIDVRRRIWTDWVDARDCFIIIDCSGIMLIRSISNASMVC